MDILGQIRQHRCRLGERAFGMEQPSHIRRGASQSVEPLPRSARAFTKERELGALIGPAEFIAAVLVTQLRERAPAGRSQARRKSIGPHLTTTRRRIPCHALERASLPSPRCAALGRGRLIRPNAGDRRQWTVRFKQWRRTPDRTSRPRWYRHSRSSGLIR
jgi:hypothetical protein